MKRLLTTLLFIYGFMMTTSAQNSVLQIPSEVKEKIYIHFDKPYYVAGETIWYKSYFYRNGFPSVSSDEVYLQLQDEAGNIIDKKRHPISGAAATGNIILSDSLPAGQYILKAITATMAAFDSTSFYSKKMLILNPNLSLSASSLPKKISLQFFAESGHLIDRIRTRVAFKATNENGLPIQVSGIVKSDSTSVVATFQALHDGMGSFSLTPHLGDSLVADVEFSGKKYFFPLPAIESSGIYLKITDNDSGKIFEVTRSKKNQEQFDTVKLIVTSNADTVFQTAIIFGNQLTLGGILKTEKIPSGILHFTLFSQSGIPLATRLSFVNNLEYVIPAALSIIKRDSSKNGFNNVEINFADTIQRSLSVSVTNIAAQEFPDKENIYSSLLLTSDLKGYVYNAAYYFENNDPSTMKALDNLMLTHGWTRYTRKKPAALRQVRGSPWRLGISGTLHEPGKLKTRSSGTLSLQIIDADSTVQFLETPVDKNGAFRIDSLNFFGVANIYYSYTSVSGRKYPVDIEIDFDHRDFFFSLLAHKEINTTSFNGSTGGSTGVSPGFFSRASDIRFRQLATVYVKTNIKKPATRINDKYTSMLYRNSGKLVLDNINFPYLDKSQNVINYALMRIQNLAYDAEARTLVNRKNFSLQTKKYWKVEVLLDESPASVDIAQSVTMDRVALLKFYEAGFLGVGTQAPGGALAIYLKKFEDQKDPAETNSQKLLTYDGYSLTKEFYQPDYTFSAGKTNGPDLRQTLYWNALLEEAGNGSSSQKIAFYNNDFSKSLKVIVEGFDARGKLIHFEKVF